MTYNKKSGRVTVNVRNSGAAMQDYISGCEVTCQKGYTNEVDILTMSVEEMRDLRYLLDRAIAAADSHIR